MPLLYFLSLVSNTGLLLPFIYKELYHPQLLNQLLIFFHEVVPSNKSKLSIVPPTYSPNLPPEITCLPNCSRRQCIFNWTNFLCDIIHVAACISFGFGEGIMVLHIFVYYKQPKHLKKLNYIKKKNRQQVKTLSVFQQIFPRENKVFPFKKVFLPVMPNWTTSMENTEFSKRPKMNSTNLPRFSTAGFRLLNTSARYSF